MADGQIVIEITADNRQAVQAAQETSNDITNSFGGMLKKVSAAAVAAKVGKAILDWGKAAVEAASDLQEVQNVVDVTFGAASSEIEDWAKNARDQFGLTETQAKKFASTLGATMKSSGIAGSEIVEMSENLSGLAADMASFYNLDFETAFQKIRSGISGETEPLKQLGINMSVANLEAYALTQGITKAFDKMSQGEQTQLRYQYLMQATADAQGDFARTSDGYANSMRKLQTSLDSITTKLGTPLLGALATASGAISGFLDMLFPEEHKTKTVLDDFEGIDAETKRKLEETQQSYNIVIEAIKQLEELDKEGLVPQKVSAFATSANKLDASSPSNWASVLGSFSRYKDVATIWGDETKAPENIKELASALSGEQGAQAKADAIDSLLKTLRENADGIAKYSTLNKDQVLGVIGGLEEKAKDLKPDDVAGWNEWFTLLSTSFPGLVTDSDLTKLSQMIGSIAVEGNKINSQSVTNWSKFGLALEKVGGIKAEDAAYIRILAESLGSKDITTGKANAWKTMLETLKNNADGIGKIRGTDAAEAAQWLESIAVSAGHLNEADTESWNSLFTYLIEGLPGLKETDEGKEFFEAIEANANAAANSADAMSGSTKKMGDAADSASAKQAELLKIIKEQSKYFPGLNDLIDANTGELRGGTTALREYMTEWKKIRDNDTVLQGMKAQYSAILNWQAEIERKKIELLYREASSAGQAGIALMNGATYEERYANYEKFKALAQKLGQSWVRNGNGRSIPTLADFKSRNETGSVGMKWADIFDDPEFKRMFNAIEGSSNPKETEKEYLAIAQAAYDLLLQEDALTKATASFEDTVEGAGKTVADVSGEAEAAAEDAAEKTIQEMEAEKKAWEDLVKSASDATQAVIDYYNAVRQNTTQSVSSVVNGFSTVTTKADAELEKLEEKKQKIQDEIDAETDKNKKEEKRKQLTQIEVEISTVKGNGTASAQQMINSLQSQLNYMADYNKYMDAARQNKVSDEVLAQLADGSTESMEYLRALSTASDAEVAKINELYANVGEKKNDFVDKLTEQKLAVDDVWTGLVNDAESALTALAEKDQAAFDSADGLITNFINGLRAHQPELDKEIFAITSKIALLSSMGFQFKMGAPGIAGAIGVSWIPKHANGLDYVPFDGYTAMLHEGETVLTKEEAKIWRGYMDSRNTGLSGAIWNNAPNMGGDVYLDGQIVGNLISTRQGNAYRRMERSGWRG